MSAAASPWPQPSNAIRAVCRVPLSYFKQLLDLFTFTEIICFGLILDCTIGNNDSPWAEIDDKQFSDAGVVSREWHMEALGRLVKGGWIKTRKNQRGRWEYTVCDKVRLEANVKGFKFRGRCTKCQHEDVYDARYVAVPHAFFRKLGACLDHAAYVCLAVIMEHSLKWSGADGITSKLVELQINDFERETGLDDSSIGKALARLCDEDGWGLVERVTRKGKAALYRAIPERFHQIEKREARVLSIVGNRERTGNTTSKSTGTNPSKTEKSTGIELASRFPGYCPKCEAWVELEQCGEVIEVAPVEKSPPRVQPGRETRLYKQEILAPGKPWTGFAK